MERNGLTLAEGWTKTAIEAAVAAKILLEAERYSGGPVPVGALICGGFTRDIVAGDPPKDLDLFFMDIVQWSKAIRGYARSGWSQTGRSMKGRVITMSRDNSVVQCIFMQAASALALIGRFDFTCCCTAINHSGVMVASHPGALDDCKSRTLRILSLPNPAHTKVRATGLIERGWKWGTDANYENLVEEKLSQQGEGPGAFEDYLP